jgi:hypothetical protein
VFVLRFIVAHEKHCGFVFGKHPVRISHGLQDVLTEFSCDFPELLEVYARTVL